MLTASARPGSERRGVMGPWRRGGARRLRVQAKGGGGGGGGTSSALGVPSTHQVEVHLTQHGVLGVLRHQLLDLLDLKLMRHRGAQHRRVDRPANHGGRRGSGAGTGRRQCHSSQPSCASLCAQAACRSGHETRRCRVFTAGAHSSSWPSDDALSTPRIDRSESSASSSELFRRCGLLGGTSGGGCADLPACACAAIIRAISSSGERCGGASTLRSSSPTTAATIAAVAEAVITRAVDGAPEEPIVQTVAEPSCWMRCAAQRSKPRSRRQLLHLRTGVKNARTWEPASGS